MVKSRLIAVADLSGTRVRVGVLDANAPGARLERGPDTPWRAAVQLGSDGLSLLSGGAAEVGRPSAALFFDHLDEDLPRIGDTELQDWIVKEFWDELWRRPECRDMFEGRGRVVGFAVSPQLYPLALLERFRLACSGEGSDVRPAGFANEAVCLILGLIRSEHFARSTEGEDLSVGMTLCAFAGREDGVDIVCFEYRRASVSSHRIAVRDFFRAGYPDLAARLSLREWFGGLDGIIALEHPALDAHARASLDDALATLPARRWGSRRTTEDVDWLKIEGGAYVARCCLGGSGSQEEYEVETFYNIGVQSDAQRFIPVVSKDAVRRQARWPGAFRRAFRLHDPQQEGTRLNFYGGYSERIDEAIPLGSTMLPPSGYDSAAGGAFADVLLTVSLHAPGSGELVVSLPPSYEEASRHSFTLPGLVV